MRSSSRGNGSKWVWLSVLVLSLLGCYEITATFEPTTSVKAVGRGSECEHEIFTIPPQSKFRELGVVHFRDSVNQDVDNTQFLLSAATGSMDEYKKNRKPESEIKPHAEALTVTQIREPRKIVIDARLPRESQTQRYARVTVVTETRRRRSQAAAQRSKMAVCLD